MDVRQGVVDEFQKFEKLMCRIIEGGYVSRWIDTVVAQVEITSIRLDKIAYYNSLEDIRPLS